MSDRDIGLYVRNPFRSVLDGRWILLVSRRAESADGAFVGVVQIALNLEHFDGIFRNVEGGLETSFGLFKPDGACLIHSLESTACLGGKISQDNLIDAFVSDQPTGRFRGAMTLEGVAQRERIGAYTRLPQVDLIASNAIAVDDILGEWRREATIITLFAVLTIAAIGAVAWNLARGIARERAHAERLQAAWLSAKAAERRAHAASRAKSSFLSNMSHELRTPLNAVIGFSELLGLNRDGRLGATQLDHAATILQAGHHLLTLVNEVLDLASIEAGRLTIVPDSVPAQGAVELARKSMANLARQHDVAVSSEIPGALPDLRADPQRLHQILLNLLSNAIKYNRPNGNVVIRALAVGAAHVRIAVEDNGIGIPEDRRAQLFGPFHRLGAELTSVEGTGLGLALTKRLVEAMQGRIGYDSRPGYGTTFWFELPIFREISPVSI